VTDWQVVFLGIMAVALVAMAGAQVAVALSTRQAARQVADAVQALQRDVRPLVDRANRMTEDAARVVALAATQAERIDRLLAEASSRIDQTLEVVQGAVVGPIRQGAALVAAVRAAVTAVRAWQGHRGPAQRDEEETLFVG
jgi:hypothetical protein